MKPYVIHAIGVDIDTIAKEVDNLVSYAIQNPGKRFHVTEIGCEKGGYSPSDIAPLFKKDKAIKNILLPLSFVDNL